MRTGLKKFIGVTAVSGMLGGGAASVGTSAVTDSSVVMVMDAMADFIRLYRKLLRIPPWQYDECKEDAKRIPKFWGFDEHLWLEHFSERKEWKEAHDILVEIEKMGPIDGVTRDTIDEWLESNMCR